MAYGVDRIADDLLVGAKQIATFTGFTERQIFHLAGKGKLPIFRIGKALCGRKSELQKAMSAQSTSYDAG